MPMVLLFSCGACFASFIFCYIQQLHAQYYHTHSQCDYCFHRLFWFDLVPILSFIYQKRRCRYCKQNIAPQYLIVEMSFGLLFLTFFSHYGINLFSMQQFSLLLLFFILSLSDLMYYEIYLTLFIPLSFACIMYYSLTKTPLYFKQACIMTVIFLILSPLITSYIGSGDIIFFLFLSLIFPYLFLLKIVWLASVMGLVHLLYTKQRYLPYIPYIVLSIFLLFIFSS